MLPKFLELSIFFGFINCFNLDTDFPIVYFEPGKNDKIDDNSKSYFGYSVVIYPGNDKQHEWIKIGAPKANTTRSSRTVDSGVVYDCSIWEKCKPIKLPKHSGPPTAIWNGNFIGGTMDISYKYDRMTICGFRKLYRYQSPYTDYRMMGACYWSSLNTTEFNTIDPLLDFLQRHGSREATGVLRQNHPCSIKLFRIYPRYCTTDVFAYCHPAYGYIAHWKGQYGIIKIHSNHFYYYGQGQAGFSAHFPMERNELILGAPGVYNWAGTPLRVRDEEYFKPEPSRRRRSRKSTTEPLKDVEVPDAKLNQAFDLLGYSVSSGYFHEENKLLYATSSPRGGFYLGKDTKFCPADKKNRMVCDYILLFEFMKDMPISVHETLGGHEFGEYFGASLGSGQINGDSLDDLIVGAPFHKGNSFNEGKVYVYLGSEGNLRESTILEENHLNGQFGSAVMFLGDLDNDGFGDVAIGAPYENGESGVVYIYKGYKYGLRNIYSQKIIGKDIMPTLRGFGISISRAVDIDKNKFKDLAVGAHLSGNAVLLRSRPVVIIEYDFVSSPATLKQDSQSFLLKICFRYSMFENETLEIMYTMAVDKVLGRAKIDGSNDTTVMEKLIIPRMNQTCDNVAVSLNPSDNFNSSATAFPIIASLSYKLNNPVISRATTYIRESDNEINDRLCLRCPVLDTFRSNETHYEIAIPYTLDCGDDNDCRSRLIIDIDIPELSNGEPYVVGSKPYLKLEANIKNEGENAYSTKLEIVLPDTILFRQIPPTCKSVNTSAIICSVADPLRENKTKFINLDLDVNNINKELSTYELPISARVATTSNNTHVDTFTYQLKVKKEADITIYGKSEQNSNTFGSADNEFTHIYKVEKTGMSPLERITVKIEIPRYYMASTTKIPFVQLYEPKATLGNQPGACRSDFKYISVGSPKTEGIQEENISTRRRRETDVEVIQNISQIRRKEDIKINDKEITITPNKTFYINCTTNTVICSEIVCTFGPFDKKKLAIIEIKMILNISAIIGSIGDNETVLVSTRGDVDVDIPQNFTQSGNGSDSFSISSIFINEKSTNAGIALWIIIVAVIAGLLLLLILVLTLVKVGFFKRTEKQKLEDLKAAHEENHEEMLDDPVEGPQEELPEPFIMCSSLEGLCDESDQT